MSSAGAATTGLVSIGNAGAESNDDSENPAISADGRFVVFASDATNLIAGGTGGSGRIFVRDLQNNTTGLVSKSSAGVEANDFGDYPAISADGRYVAFESLADNLVPGDTNARQDIFVHDRASGNTVRVSLDSAGNELTDGAFKPSISADGRFVSFEAFDTTVSREDIYVHDRDTDKDGIFDEAGNITTVKVSVTSTGGDADNNSEDAFISADGRHVVFASAATNLVPGVDVNSDLDIYVHDRDTDNDGIFDEPGAISTVRVSVDSNGVQDDTGSSRTFPAISANGRFVAFRSTADNLVPGDANLTDDVFVHDRDTDNDGIFDEPGAISAERVSVATNGTEGNNRSREPSISADGRYVSFQSEATNLIPAGTTGERHLFVRDRQLGTTEIVSVHSDGTQGDERTEGRVQILSADGKFVVFHSRATNLVDNDTNASQDIFIHDRGIVSQPTTVAIDIKPGSDQNTINLDSAGVVPVAILSSSTFDATTVKPESVSLAGAKVRMVGKSGKYLCNANDVNHDGLMDLECKVQTVEFIIQPGDSIAVLEAETTGGVQIRGQDFIRIVP